MLFVILTHLITKGVYMHPDHRRPDRYVGDNMSMVGIQIHPNTPTQNTLTCCEGYTFQDRLSTLNLSLAGHTSKSHVAGGLLGLYSEAFINQICPPAFRRSKHLAEEEKLRTAA